MNDYEMAVIAVVSRFYPYLPPPTMDLHEQRAAIAVCQTLDMSPAVWAGLSPAERLPWLHQTLAVLAQSDGPTSAAVDDWSDAKPPAVWRKELGISETTLRRHVAVGRLVVDKLTSKRWRIRNDSLRRYLASK